MNNKVVYIIGFATIVAIVIAALAIGNMNGKEFGGADDQGGDVIGDLDPDYEPWWNGILGDYEIPDETESMLFALQAAIGAIVIGFFMGMLYAKNKIAKEKGSEDISDEDTRNL